MGQMNGLISGCRRVIPAIMRVSRGLQAVRVPLTRVADCTMSLGIPHSNRVV